MVAGYVFGWQDSLAVWLGDQGVGHCPFIVAHCSLHNFCEDLETEDPADSELGNMQLEDDPVLIRLGLA